MAAAGSFDITLAPQNHDTAPAGRMLINKVYSGGMQGSGDLTGISGNLSIKQENNQHL